jgi:demethylspheroidene O-methyltransferase
MKPKTTDDVLDLMDSNFTSAALGAAMELGLFWLLEETPLDGAAIAKRFGIPLNRCLYWLQLLGAAGLVEPSSGRYVPTAAARTAVLDAFSRESWALLAEEARRRYPDLRDLALHIGEPGSVVESLGLKPWMFQGAMVENQDLARRFTRMLYELHQHLAEELAGFLDLQGVRRLMDLGGGSGVVSMALLRRHPDLEAVVVDVANVCAAGREIAIENDLQDRIHYHPADFFRDDLPSGFDLVLECDVNIYSEALFSKVRGALKDGGRFVVIDQLAPEEGMAPASRVHWAFRGSLRDPEFAFLTPAGIRTMLERVGFRKPSVRALPPFDDFADRFNKGTVLIEAVK